MNKKDYIYLTATLLIVFIFYAHTVPYPFREFDESLVFRELVFPMPQSLHEFIEYGKQFGFNVYFEASNVFYSKIGNLRLTNVNCFLTMFMELCFQKKAWLYHCLSLSLHIINTGLLFLCLQRLKGLSLPIISLLALLFALHPVQIESVLFACNALALLAYGLAFLTFYLATEEGK